VTSKDARPKDAARLRQRAEEMARVKGASSPETMSQELIQRTLHELQVHQIELEIQNEELRRTHVELEESRARYVDLYDFAPVGYCTLSEQGLILEANLTVARLLGEARGALIKQPFTHFVLPEDQDIHYWHFKRVLETGAPQAWELRLLRKDTGPFWARMEMTTAHDAGGGFLYRAVVSDIAERKFEEQEKTRLEGEKRQIEFRQRQEERLAQQRLESVATLASGIAHDFNNLLGGVLAQSELVLEELAAGLRPEEEVKRIQAAAIRGSEIVRQLLIYAGKESDVLELVDVSRTIQEMLELLKTSVSKRAVVKTVLGRDLPAVTASPTQLRRVVMNLITNASEAIGDQDGVIRVTTRRVRVGRDWNVATLEPLAEGDYVQVEVSDTGRGMGPEMQARMFDPFFTSKSEGRGLGLAVVREIVRSLRGTISITSAPEKGCTFQILLPCAEVADQTTHRVISPAKDEALQLQTRTILIVEDEESLRQSISKMARKVGHSVIEASNGSEALDLIRAYQPHIDVLLLDVTLPRAPSRDVFGEARRLRPDMRVIVTSAYSEAMAASSLGVPPQHFIRKPYRLGELMELITEAAHGQRG
jgi:PAS domain S-box-containing protein